MCENKRAEEALLGRLAWKDTGKVGAGYPEVDLGKAGVGGMEGGTCRKGGWGPLCTP